MSYCHRHNLVDPGKAGIERRFGIRVTLPSTDTFRTVIGDDWERFHWYPEPGPVRTYEVTAAAAVPR